MPSVLLTGAEYIVLLAGVTSVFGVISPHGSGLDLVVIEVRAVGGGGEHHCVGSAARAAGGDEIVTAARQIAKENVILNIASGRLLAHQTGGGVTGVAGVAVFV